MTTLLEVDNSILQATLEDSQDAIRYLLKKLVEEAKISGKFVGKGHLESTTRIIDMIKNNSEIDHFRDLIEHHIVTILDEYS